MDEVKDYIKAKHVKELVNNLSTEGKQCRLGGDLIEKLNEKVQDLILDARYRAEQNERVTIQGKDL